ncbi:hypothetical protein Daura_20315 [Dactylosporangium aurantiacum]|uniref:Uncharacterized protein n=1 Tax=Dactylosporangium aurantiacum TaxID=35754 RepID=A0A9Q9IQV8_9ACTN|nr:hypothetical protein [Dactylosporangium aurantiacum]MDG6106188.1 hypothetical protein [Dactylosporangium aurantiacum]UWZ58310.1 hypothetical protein Daura_20315 [Dactylosporangium aurantiacum]
MTAPTAATTGRPAGRWSLGAALGAVSGLAPHLLHHVGLLTGAALVAGLGGTVLFGVLGLAVMAPMLVRLRRRFRSRWAPGIAVTLFAAMFLVSTFVIGPAAGVSTDRPAEPSHAPAGNQHTRHHP